ncbi:hypothetical protein GCM10016455_16210 [Aliiroseovarius zhejiangensis]|uniref:Uncharacterized protein n=1 Tax=Aliiroseovarius zhejiangensis TaxID=1632025 RepID=A0ABQ3IWM4_9RHOB|nr:hypothetical protein [Aliiroseovarius zhejiangensis]GHE96565.1 hypothetical protein GCM10016455_16210 [Aliiroseovarius zhejiangensis]
MPETETPDANLRCASARAHALRTQFVQTVLRRMTGFLRASTSKKNGASLSGQPRVCDCPA